MSIKNTVIIGNQMEELIHAQTLAGSPVQSSIEWIFRTGSTLGSVLCGVYDVDSKALKECKNLPEIVSSHEAMAVVAAHSALLKLFMGSQTALKAMIASDAAMTAILSSESAWKTFTANTAAVGYLIKEEHLFQAVLDNETCWQVFINASAAMTVVRNDSEAVKIITASEKHTLDIIRNATAFNQLIASDLFRESLLSVNNYWREALNVEHAFTKMIGTIAIFNQIIASDTHWKDFMAAQNALEYAVKDKTAFNAILKSEKNRFKDVADSKEAMTAVCATSTSRTILYDYYRTTETILRNSAVAIDCMKKSANYKTVSGTPTQKQDVSTTLYSGKAFVIQIRGSKSLNEETRVYHGIYPSYGHSAMNQQMTNTQIEVMRFASSVGNGIWPSVSNYTLYHDIFTI